MSLLDSINDLWQGEGRFKRPAFSDSPFFGGYTEDGRVKVSGYENTSVSPEIAAKVAGNDSDGGILSSVPVVLVGALVAAWVLLR